MTRTTASTTSLGMLTSLDGRYQAHIKPLVAYFSEGAFIQTRIEVEIHHLISLSQFGIIRKLTPKEKKQLQALPSSLNKTHFLRIKELEEITHHDVKAMERGLRELIVGTSLEDIAEFIHFGLTSEDINNICHRLHLHQTRKEILVPQLLQILANLTVLAQENKSLPMLARTHGQPAVPTTLGKEFANFAVRLDAQIKKLVTVQLTGKLNGAVGNYNALVLAAPKIDWIAYTNEFIKSIGLVPNLFTTQINPYEDIIEYMQTIQRINGILLDLNQDMWRYISDKWLVQEAKKGEVGSSTMPQKVNPIYFENSEGNIVMANSLIEGMVRKLSTSRLQRDLSDSTVLRNIGTVLGFSLVSYKNTLEGLGRIKPNEEKIRHSLYEDWSILTEAVQTLLRKAGTVDPYALIASISRGKEISKQDWQQWIAALPQEIDKKTRKELALLTPERYLGNAVELTEMALQQITHKEKSS